MTTAIEYLQALEEELKYLPAKETRKVIQVYQEKINNALDYGEKIEKILKDLPTPSEVAKGIYDSKKVNYLDKRQREYRRKEMINGITSLILSIIVALIFVGIIGYLSIVSFNMLEIIPKFSSQDKLIMSGFVIFYFLAMFLVIIYLLDLGIMIFMFLITKFLQIFKNLNFDYELLQSFSITGLVEKWTKKKNFLGKVLLGIVVIIVVFGATSVVSNGYLNRSFSDKVSLENEEVVELEDSVTEIILKNTNAKVIIQKGDSFRIIKHSEFDRNFEVEKNSQQVTVSFDEKRSYDFLGLLNEPTIVIQLEIPEGFLPSLVIKLNSGEVSLNQVNLSNVDLELMSGNVILKDTKIQDLNFTTDDGKYNSNSCNFGGAVLNVEHGRFASSDDIFGSANINNGSGEIAIQNNEFKELKLNNTSGTVVIQKSNISVFDYVSVASILTMGEIDSEYFNLTSKNASQFTLTDLEAELFTFDLNTGYINMSKVVGDINIVKSLSNITISELVGDINGNIENSKFAVYNSIFKNLKASLKSCTLDLDNVTIDNINITADKTQALWIDVYSKDIHLDMNTCNLEYLNNSDKIIGKIYIKNINSNLGIDETVKYGELVVE